LDKMVQKNNIVYDEYPFVTIGVIAKNEEEFIEETINNLLKISYPKDKFEIVFVNDRSTDKTRKIVEKIRTKHSKIKIIDTKKHKFYGPCYARNCVIENSSKKAKYIAFTDADCLVKNNWLNILVEKMNYYVKDSQIIGAGGLRYVHPKDSKRARIINTYLTSIGSGGSAAFLRKKIKFIDSIANYNAIYKKEILAKNRYDNRLILSDDNELNYRLKKKGYKFIYAPEAIVYHHETGSLKDFFKNMIRYGDNITRTTYKHRTFIRWYTAILPLFVLYLTLGWLLLFIHKIFISIYAGVLLLYLIFDLCIATKNTILKKDFNYMLFFVLMPLQHIGYGFGTIKGFIKNRWVLKLK